MANPSFRCCTNPLTDRVRILRRYLYIKDRAQVIEENTPPGSTSALPSPTQPHAKVIKKHVGKQLPDSSSSRRKMQK